MYSDWINRGIHKPGKSAIGLGEALKKSRGTVYKMIANERVIRADELEAIAAYIEEPPPIGMADSSSLITIPVERTIGVGIWFEESGLTTGDTITVSRDPEFPKAKHLAYRWDSDSMDAIAITSGDIIICLALTTPAVLINGQLVVIERNRGGVIELTLKVISIHEDRTEYRPMSNNPIHKSIIQSNTRKTTGIETVKVIGIVRKIERIVRRVI